MVGQQGPPRRRDATFIMPLLWYQSCASAASSHIHHFFNRITEWGYPNAPQWPLVFAGDLPIVDQPLPRFLDDGAAAKLLQASRRTRTRSPG
jgi:hypothetical protein